MLKPSECSKCPLYTLSLSFSKVDGKYTIPLLFVGESLSHEDSIDGLPFRPFSQAGSKLKQAIELAGYNRQDFAYWNIIACQPPGNKLNNQWYEESAKNYCFTTYFIKVINELKPKVIITLGNTSFRYLTKQDELSVLDVRGYPFQYNRGMITYSPVPIILPTLHPSFIKRGKEYLTPLLVEDIKKGVRMAKGEGNYKLKFIERKIRLSQEYKKNEYDYTVSGTNTELDDDIPF